MPISVSSLSLNTYNRISGLETGLDTEAIVDGLTLAEQSKVIAAHREKQLLIWKRDAYREIIENSTGFTINTFPKAPICSKACFRNFPQKHRFPIPFGGSGRQSVVKNRNNQGHSLPCLSLKACQLRSRYKASGDNR